MNPGQGGANPTYVLKGFQHLEGYRFKLEFVNGEIKTTDLTDLIAKHVGFEDLSSARVDPEWGCLEFNNGSVDIEPKTLYIFAAAHHLERAA